VGCSASTAAPSARSTNCQLGVFLADFDAADMATPMNATFRGQGLQPTAKQRQGEEKRERHEEQPTWDR
jgi:hypothetical protein